MQNVVLATILGAYTKVHDHMKMVDHVYRGRIRMPRSVEFMLPLMYTFYPFESELLKLLEGKMIEPMLPSGLKTGLFGRLGRTTCTCRHAHITASQLRLYRYVHILMALHMSRHVPARAYTYAGVQAQAATCASSFSSIQTCSALTTQS